MSDLATLDRLQSPERDAAHAAALATLERRVLGPARAAGADLECFGVTRTPGPSEELRIVMDGRGVHWVVAPPDRDPTRERGLIPVPQVQLHRLQTLRSAGVELDYVYVAHELPETWRPGEPIPQLVPPPPRIAASERVVARTANITLRALKASAVGVATALAAPLSFAALDPMVIGGVLSDNSDSVAWAILASWTWR